MVGPVGHIGPVGRSLYRAVGQIYLTERLRFKFWLDLDAAPTYTDGMSKKNAAWIRTIPRAEADQKLLRAIEGQACLYPPEYKIPVESLESAEEKSEGAGIMMSHSLIPDALYHAFSTYGSLLSPELPLSRRQHEMIAATVSSLNRCFY